MPYPNKAKKTSKQYPWVAQVKIKGKKRSSLCRTRKEAITWEEEEKEHARKNPDQKTRWVSLLDWGTKYCEYAEKNFVYNTFIEKKKAFKEFLRNDEIDPYSPVDELEPITVLEHLQEQEEKRSGNAANRDRKNLSAAWTWGVTYMGLPYFNPIAVTQKFAEDRNERPVPTMDDFTKVLDATTNEQDRAMLWLYMQTGARRDELFRLRWKDVDFKNQRVRLFYRKNKKGEWKNDWIPVRPEFMSLLRVQQRTTGFCPFVFMNFNNSENPKDWVPFQYRNHFLPTLCKRAGVKEFGFHGIRHLFASILAAENVPLVEIQALLRHKSLTTTAKYVHRLKKENREVLEALPGLDLSEKNSTRGPDQRPDQNLNFFSEVAK